MLDAFFTGVLPVFAVLAVGYIAGKAKFFDVTMAAAINRFVILIAVPLLVPARAPFHEFDWTLLGAFLASELCAYGAGFLVARNIFKRELRESILLGLASSFANHLLFVLPIAMLLYGERASVPIVAIASVDALTIYGGTLMLMETLSGRRPSAAQLVGRFAKNPAIVAIPLGLAVALIGAPLPKGIDAFGAFISQTASPCALFALGIILSQQTECSAEAKALPISMAAIKLVGHPLAAAALIYYALPVAPEWPTPTLLVAGAPSAAMAFVFALQYKVRMDAIARTVLYTSIGSLLTLIAGWA